MRPTLAVLLAALLVAVLSACLTSSPSPTASPSPLPSNPLGIPAGPPVERTADQAPTPTELPSSLPGELSLTTLLSLLVVAPENRQGYERDLFPTWTDADGDGCNARREVLIAESLTAVEVGPGCSLTHGTWYSAYDGLTFTDIADVSIDHVVALAEAWDSGASSWDAARREGFANDLGVPWTLVGVSEPSNSAKSDLDPTVWLPDEADDQCDFVADWLAVKVRWSLTVDQREHDALADLAAACPGTTRAVIVAPTPRNEPPTPPLPVAAGCDPAYPSVCIPPPPPDLDCADVTFRRFAVLPPDPHHFDGDGNGIGCEG